MAGIAGAALVGLAGLFGTANAQSVNVILDKPAGGVCVAAFGLPPETDDVNNEPQGEVWIDISESGRLAAAAKDNRFSPPNDVS